MWQRRWLVQLHWTYAYLVFCPDLYLTTYRPVLSLSSLAHDQEINYDSPRGGVSVITEKGDVTTSFLLIQRARKSDSGKYTCAPSNANPVTVNVHILNGTYNTPQSILSQYALTYCPGMGPLLPRPPNNHLLLCCAPPNPNRRTSGGDATRRQIITEPSVGRPLPGTYPLSAGQMAGTAMMIIRRLIMTVCVDVDRGEGKGCRGWSMTTSRGAPLLDHFPINTRN